MYEYRAKIIKVIDGDTVDVDIDLGFGVVLTDERVRMMGIDTPESRTRDKVEKKFGLASKARLKEILGKQAILQTQINRNGEDMKGKFGRILGDFLVYDSSEDATKRLTEVMISQGYGVAYHGQSKDDIHEAHMANRKRLIEAKVVTL